MTRLSLKSTGTRVRRTVCSSGIGRPPSKDAIAFDIQCELAVQTAASLLNLVMASKHGCTILSRTATSLPESVPNRSLSLASAAATAADDMNGRSECAQTGLECTRCRRARALPVFFAFHLAAAEEAAAAAAAAAGAKGRDSLTAENQFKNRTRTWDRLCENHETAALVTRQKCHMSFCDKQTTGLRGLCHRPTRDLLFWGARFFHPSQT